MATKKPASTTKKSTNKSVEKVAPSAPSKTTTKVTTMQATASKPAARRSERFSFSRSPLLTASIAEFIGTFMLAAVVLVSSGSAIIVLFALVAIVLAVGAVSGSHLNPAITVAAFVTRRINAARTGAYLVAQALGALLALTIVNSFVTSAPGVSAEAAQFGQQAEAIFSIENLVEGKEWMIFAGELIGATIFGFGFAAVYNDPNRLTRAFGIGGALFVALAVGGYLVNILGSAAAVLNPAVAISTQSLSWDFMPLMVYVIAPLIGATLGFGLRDMLKDETVA